VPAATCRRPGRCLAHRGAPPDHPIADPGAPKAAASARIIGPRGLFALIVADAELIVGVSVVCASSFDFAQDEATLPPPHVRSGFMLSEVEA
jgi:hypothetical protein